MSTFAEDIEEAAGKEPILAIRIESRDRGWSFDAVELDESYVGTPLTWDTARPLLDYEYDTGYGGQDCHDFTAWTASRVLFVHEYDGSTYVRTVDRNPTEGAE